jgi:hypothetical protein
MPRVRIVFHDPRGAYRLLAELARISSPLRWLVKTRREGARTILEVPATEWNGEVKELVVGFGGQEDREATDRASAKGRDNPTRGADERTE